MKKVFNVYGHDVEFTTCTAIAVGVDENRQSALFIHDLTDEFGNGDGVVFYDMMPTDNEEAAMLLDDCEVDTDYETLETVQF